MNRRGFFGWLAGLAAAPAVAKAVPESKQIQWNGGPNMVFGGGFIKHGVLFVDQETAFNAYTYEPNWMIAHLKKMQRNGEI